MKEDKLDFESRLEVIYRILKDQLRKTKRDLLNVKKDKENERKRALEWKRRMENAARNKEASGSLANKIVVKK